MSLYRDLKYYVLPDQVNKEGSVVVKEMINGGWTERMVNERRIDKSEEMP